ncbi:MAG TPA: MCE family protein [Pseudonocardiaceae bacterium]|jgi:virulence factor Mce-like protein|nr:MCE family protein [Pseudonocardiaceae bacterium]
MSISETRAGRDLGRVVAIACVLGLLLAGGLWWILYDQGGIRITAYFSKTVGVYPGSAVRVLGLQVGTIDDVEPQGALVRVDLTVDEGVQIPAKAQAVIVAPSLVSDRYVQLVPAYSDGPIMGGGAVIPTSRTATPVELDDLYASLDKLATALGPNGANQKGALSNLLNTTAANLNGNGQKLADTITQLAAAATTLSNAKGNLFDTVDGLQKFTTALADSDSQMRGFDDNLADVSGYLADDRNSLATALTTLASALTQVQGFIQDNQGALESTVHNLSGVTQALVDQRSALAEVLDVAPLGLSGYLNSYDAASGSFAVRGDLNELTDPPIEMICKLIQASTPANLPAFLSDACGKLAPVLDGTLKLPSVAQDLQALQEGKLPPLPLPIAGTLFSQGSGQ